MLVLVYLAGEGWGRGEGWAVGGSALRRARPAWHAGTFLSTDTVHTTSTAGDDTRGTRRHAGGSGLAGEGIPRHGRHANHTRVTPGPA